MVAGVAPHRGGFAREPQARLFLLRVVATCWGVCRVCVLELLVCGAV